MDHYSWIFYSERVLAQVNKKNKNEKRPKLNYFFYGEAKIVLIQKLDFHDFSPDKIYWNIISEKLFSA
jgi:hypothetical protein